MSDIAFAAGFASIRQFNDTVREVFAVSPTTMRTESRRSPRSDAVAPAAPGLLTLRLPYREPLDTGWLAWFLSAHTVPGMELWEDGVYTRGLRTPHGHATVRLSFQPGHVRAELALRDMRDLAPTVARVRHLLDLDADPQGIDEGLGLAVPDNGLPVVATAAPGHGFGPGIRVPGCLDGPELLLRTMIGQQISVQAAATHTARLVGALGDRIDGPAPRLFPTPDVVAERGAEVLTGPARRVSAVVAAARAIAEGELVLHSGRTAAELRRDLLALAGVGPWTADYVTVRLLADPDILLGTDLVVRQGATLAGVDLDHTTRWAPWRSYLSMHLWKTALEHRGVIAAPRPSRPVNGSEAS